MTEYRPVYTGPAFDGAFDDLSDRASTPLPTHEDARSLFDPTRVPPEPRFLIPRFIALGTTGLLAAAGGTGKSYLALQLAVAVATGCRFVGEPVIEPGGVVYFGAEDDPDTIRRRLYAIVMRETDFLDEARASKLIHLIRERLYIVSRVGEDNCLLARDPATRRLAETPYASQARVWCSEIPEIRLIIFDTVSRHFGGDENSAEDATRLVEMLESFRKTTGATVLAIHHANKGAIRSGDATQAAARGSSAFTDGVRLQIQLRTMRTDEAPHFGLTADQAGNYASLSLTKSNHTPPRPPIWLERREGGVLVPASLDTAGSAAFRIDSDMIIDTICEAEQGGRQYTKHGFVEAHAGKGGKLGVADKRMRRLINDLLATGRLTVVPGKDSLNRTVGVLSATASNDSS